MKNILQNIEKRKNYIFQLDLQRIVGLLVELLSYDALVRTYDSAQTVERTLESLKTQTRPPAHIVVIDSGSNDNTKKIAEDYGCIVRDYVGKKFNYSSALNQGFEYVQAPLCLVLSSHVALTNSGTVEALMALLEKEQASVSYVNYLETTDSTERITANNFNGFNGIWNVCALYRVGITRLLKFDESVPTAEDQHFASRLFAKGLSTAVLCGAWIHYNNPRANSKKNRNEYVSVSYYSYRENLKIKNIIKIGILGAKSIVSADLSSAYDRFALAVRLVFAHFSAPRYSSRYFND